MFVKDTETTINVTLQKSSNFANFNTLAKFDLVVEKDKAVTYSDNMVGVTGAALTAPTATTDGLLTFKYTPTAKGLHRLVISTGIATSYTVLGTIRVAVIEPTTTAALLVKLPTA
jgi:hypothetical protein